MRSAWKFVLLIVVLGFLSGPLSQRASADDDLDTSKWKIDTYWWFSKPHGYFNSTDGGYFDLERDFGFGSYSTFLGTADWRLTRRNHILFSISPLNSSRTTTLTRTIEFQGKTYEVGATVKAKVDTLAVSVGYQYDIFRRRQWNLGVVGNFMMLNTKASLSGEANAGGEGVSQTASASYFAPLPEVGARFHSYLIPNSNKLVLDGTVMGMSFFGYGNIVTGSAAVGYRLTDKIDLRGGYQVGSRLSIHGTSDQLGIRLTQQGPYAGVEFHWGEQ